MAPRRVTPSGSLLLLSPEMPVPATAPGLPISNARLAMVIFLAFETMLFAAFIAAFLVFRLSATAWPPADLPSLPIAVTWLNTFVLIASGYAMSRAVRGLRRADQRQLERGLMAAGILGSLFLAVQGSEWVRLVQHGLTLSTGMYGATFYTLIGIHGVHVLSAVLWLLILVVGVQRDRFRSRVRVPIELCAMYWYFVVAVWGALFYLVYLL